MSLGQGGPVSGKGEVTITKLSRKYHARTRRSFCFGSACQILKYKECHILHRTYPALVPALVAGVTKVKVLI